MIKQDFIGSEYKSKTVLWDGGNDTFKTFRKTAKKKPEDWYYRNKKLSYEMNSHGFRAPEFDKVSWKDSVVVIGCSTTMGVGNAVEDCVPSILETIIDMPVINMGISGSAVDHACWNSLVLHEHYPKPKALVHIWSNIARYTDFLVDPIADNRLPKYDILGTMMQPQSCIPQMDRYCVRHSWDVRSKMYTWADRALWKNQLPYVEASFFKNTKADLPHIGFVEEIDQARDQDHPGYQTNQLMARLVAVKLKEQGL